MSKARLNLGPYILPDFDFTNFKAGKKVLDVGCGGGRHLEKLKQVGCDAYGIDPDATAVEDLRNKGFKIITGCAESLPFDDCSLDGIVCCVVLPYTDEKLGIKEWARVLVEGGVVRASYHGLGYGLLHTVQGPDLKGRLYGIRMILNTVYYRLSGKRFAGWVGDTICQSSGRLRDYYDRYGLRLVEAPSAKTFLGFPVFLYHVLAKSL